jgi:hypothetical protein
MTRAAPRSRRGGNVEPNVHPRDNRDEHARFVGSRQAGRDHPTGLQRWIAGLLVGVADTACRSLLGLV